MMARSWLTLSRPLLLGLGLSCFIATSTAQPVRPNSWTSLVDRFIEDHLAAHPLGAVAAGRHEFDGQFPDWSREGIRGEIERLRAWQEAIQDYDDERLTPTQRFEKRYLQSVVRGDIFWLDSADWPFRNPAFYFDRRDGLDPSAYVMYDYAPAADRLEALTVFLQGLPAAVGQIQSNLSGPLPRTYIDYAVIRFGGLSTYIQDDLESAFHEVGDSQSRARFDAARRSAATALDEFVAGLEDMRSAATNDFALGRTLFLEMLREVEMLDLSLEELQQIATDDLERNLTELGVTCESYAPNQSLRACMQQMAAKKPPAGPVETARTQLAVLRSHVVNEDLLTLPIDDEPRVEEAPPFARNNLAYLMFTGPFEAEREAIFYMAGPDPIWSEQVKRDFLPGEGYLLSLTAHEVLPGHYAQVQNVWTSGSIVQQLFYSLVFVEGWAHYAEELLVETAFQSENRDFRLGQLSWALQRNVRFLCAIGLHTGGMTVEECEDMFRNEAFQDEGTARQQAARGTYEPLYLSYTLGKLMIREMREDWTKERGGRSAFKQFHDTFLSYGWAPIPLIQDEIFGP